jgi:hypothetical protein
VVPFATSRLYRPRRRWDDNITTGIREMRCEDGKRKELAQDCIQWLDLFLKILVPLLRKDD